MDGEAEGKREIGWQVDRGTVQLDTNTLAIVERAKLADQQLPNVDPLPVAVDEQCMCSAERDDAM